MKEKCPKCYRYHTVLTKVDFHGNDTTMDYHCFDCLYDWIKTLREAFNEKEN